MNESAAEKYARIKKEKLKGVETEKITSPTGMEWEVRRPELSLFMVTGMLPTQMAAKLEKAAEQANGNQTAAFYNLDWKTQAKSLEFSGKLLKHICVNPRIVENATEGDEISQDDIEWEDVAFLLEWANSKGGEADKLGNFR